MIVLLAVTGRPVMVMVAVAVAVLGDPSSVAAFCSRAKASSRMAVVDVVDTCFRMVDRLR